MFYTYAHYRADDNRLFYIGKGKGNRYRRPFDRNKHWHHIADRHGFKTEILARWENEQDAFDHEKFLIKLFRDMGYVLANYTDGGDGSSGVKMTQEQKDVVSERFKGKKLSPDHIEKVRKANIGKKHSDETKQKLRVLNTGKTLTAETKQKISVAGKNWVRDASMRMKLSLSHKGLKKPSLNKRVRCMSLELDFLSVTIAASVLGLNPNSIGRCCNGTLLTTGGLRFEWIK
jgi:group I intron endonuclease